MHVPIIQSYVGINRSMRIRQIFLRKEKIVSNKFYETTHLHPTVFSVYYPVTGIKMRLMSKIDWRFNFNLRFFLLCLLYIEQSGHPTETDVGRREGILS